MAPKWPMPVKGLWSTQTNKLLCAPVVIIRMEDTKLGRIYLDCLAAGVGGLKVTRPIPKAHTIRA